MNCSACGKLNADGVLFCVFCGTKMESGSASNSEPAAVQPATGGLTAPACGQCGAALTPGKRFCKKCGQPVSVATVVTEPSQVPVEATVPLSAISSEAIPEAKPMFGDLSNPEHISKFGNLSKAQIGLAVGLAAAVLAVAGGGWAWYAHTHQSISTNTTTSQNVMSEPTHTAVVTPNARFTNKAEKKELDSTAQDAREKAAQDARDRTAQEARDRAAQEAPQVQMQSMIGDEGKMSGLIATNASQLEILKHKGDRNYVEFSLLKDAMPTLLSTVKLKLDKVDNTHSRYTLTVSADGRDIVKKDKNIDEPVQFYTGKDPVLFELVVNNIEKNQVSGYLSMPAPPLHAGSHDSQPAEAAAQSVADNSAAPVEVSSGTVAGMIIFNPEPVYPAIAKAAHVQGAVILHAIISKEGTIEKLSVISGNGMLVNAARDAVSHWRYRPYMVKGVPVEVETSITVNFPFGGG
jgi:TonB family protein